MDLEIPTFKIQNLTISNKINRFIRNKKHKKSIAINKNDKFPNKKGKLI